MRTIKGATENGELGHYSVINNNEIFCVHTSDASDERKSKVQRRLWELCNIECIIRNNL